VIHRVRSGARDRNGTRWRSRLPGGFSFSQSKTPPEVNRRGSLDLVAGLPPGLTTAEGVKTMAAKTVHDRAESRKKIQARIAKKAIDVDKLAKLLRLLASNHDGEVLGAVGALKRALAAGGSDINEMAAAIAAGLTPGAPAKPQQQPTRWVPPAPDTTYWESMAWWAHFYRQHLSTTDRDYVHGTLLGENFDCGRADAHMMRRLRDIVAKVKAARSAEAGW
jgi:hypothetical protein